MNTESSITQGYRDERAAGGGGWGVITQLREDTEEPSLCCGPQESPLATLTATPTAVIPAERAETVGARGML